VDFEIGALFILGLDWLILVPLSCGSALEALQLAARVRRSRFTRWDVCRNYEERCQIARTIFHWVVSHRAQRFRSIPLYGYRMAIACGFLRNIQHSTICQDTGYPGQNLMPFLRGSPEKQIPPFSP
jgi:hypothetical protein